ncbi:MAG: DUF1573 domain-containing protein [Planctomycetes bacterium]|nr:DUF1573 domain-containing protein [Planctomycetota bacterium]NOG55150.1 DUF1573 domain-containing protein [Planctomycetota bacterium]
MKRIKEVTWPMYGDTLTTRHNNKKLHAFGGLLLYDCLVGKEAWIAMGEWSICAGSALVCAAAMMIPGQALASDQGTAAGMAVVSQDGGGQPSTGQQEPGPRLTFDHMRLELGVVNDLESVPFEFPFENTGTEPLVITKIKSSCKCTVPELEKTEYQPGERGVILATFNPEFRKGSENKAITITSNDVELPTMRLMVHVTVDPIVDLEQFNYDAGEVIHGTSATIDVLLRTEMSDLRVNDLEISGPNITWEVHTVRTVTVDPSEITPEEAAKSLKQHDEPFEVLETTLRFTIDETTPLEPFRRSVEAAMTLVDENDQEIEYKVLFGLTARIVSDLWLRPYRVAAGRILPGQAFTSTVRLSSRKGLKFNVNKVEHLNGNGRVDPGEELAAEMDVTYRKIEGPGENSMTYYEFVLKGHAPKSPGRFFGTVMIYTDYEADPVLSIRYSGVALEP